MIHRLIELSLRNRGLVIAIYLGIAAGGYWALLRTPIDAIPDLSDNQVIVFTDWTGRSPKEVEDQVTYPLVTSLQGLPGVRVVRASSAFSFSMINMIFEDNVELYWARTRVLERFNLVAKQLPRRRDAPTLGPDATGVGQIFWYTLESRQDEPARPALGAGLVRPLPIEFGSRASPRSRRSAVMFSSIRSTSIRISCVAYNMPLVDGRRGSPAFKQQRRR